MPQFSPIMFVNFLCIRMSVFCHDATSRFVFIMSRGQRSRPYILPEDLITLVQDVVDTHPGLAFLKEAAEFHSRYVHTVIARIFYTVNRSWTGRISLPELRRSNFLQVTFTLRIHHRREGQINSLTFNRRTGATTARRRRRHKSNYGLFQLRTFLCHLL